MASEQTKSTEIVVVQELPAVVVDAVVVEKEVRRLCILLSHRLVTDEVDMPPHSDSSSLISLAPAADDVDAVSGPSAAGIIPMI